MNSHKDPKDLTFTKFSYIVIVFFFFLRVTEIQEVNPNITTSKQVFNVGDILDATCTSGPSKPVPEITWLVNGRKVLFLFLIIYVITKRYKTLARVIENIRLKKKKRREKH